MGDGTNIQPWQPDTDKLRLAVLGKLIEECNELSARAARCIIQGIDERDPESQRTNHEELAREMADVQACIVMASDVLDIAVDGLRFNAKLSGFAEWHDMIASASKHENNDE